MARNLRGDARSMLAAWAAQAASCPMIVSLVLCACVFVCAVVASVVNVLLAAVPIAVFSLFCVVVRCVLCVRFKVCSMFLLLLLCFDVCVLFVILLNVLFVMCFLVLLLSCLLLCFVFWFVLYRVCVSVCWCCCCCFCCWSSY